MDNNDTLKSVNNEQFSSELRTRTKDAHDASDKHINLKLAAVLTDPKLWAQAIVEFYFVFQQIEKSLDQLKDHPKVGPIAVAVGNGMRTPAFEKDIEFYIGSEWRSTVKPSSSTVAYCNRIAQVTDEDPVLLIAYVHSMYLALLAGGQIMRKIVKKTLGLSGEEGLEVFSFELADRAELRQHIKDVIDNLEISCDEKDAIVNEKIRIFRMNNLIASNIETSWANYWRLAQFGLVAIAVPTVCILLVWFMQRGHI